ncbi:MAG: M23 family metallopeptidase [Acidobacteriota bacterium]|nr:M23 family metallopeptidase [Acidobacteriota bacterium]
MNGDRHSRTRFLLASLALVVAVVVLVARISRTSRGGERIVLTRSQSESLASPQLRAISETAVRNNSPVSSASATPVPGGLTPSPSSIPGPTAPAPAATPSNLIIPVTGVRAEQLHDTFSESRSEGRVHDAIDIIAPRGTPVVAAADGIIMRLFHSDRGGTTIYQLSTDKKFVYYYAHLDHYAEGLEAGHFAKQGETIAYVGDTGNAVAGNYHLHFSISVIADPKRYWEGTNINPYPLLRGVP